jgi:hypothetical protein
MPEVVEALGFTAGRREILRGLLAYRAALVGAGFTGFQWIDGSFVEDNESPNDVDVVTFVDASPTPPRLDLFAGPTTKVQYRCDTYVVELRQPNPAQLVREASYWLSLFSHRRGSFEWKGILQVSLGAGGRDDLAVNVLREMEGA